MSLRVRSVLVLVIGTVLGLTVSIGSSMLAEQHRPVAASPGPVRDESMALLEEALQRVRREYVNQLDEKTLVENAIRGMLDGLDQHSRYLDREEYEDIRIATTGNYTGVGLDIAVRDDGKLIVESPIQDAPAALAGIQAGDVVLSIDDEPIDSFGVQGAIVRMRGQPGTEVRLTVSRAGEADALDFSLIRAPIHVNTVKGEYLPGGYAYLRLSGFSDSTVDELNAAAGELIRESGGELTGMVLDLRNNPGGVLQAAIGVADVFLDDGLIVRGSGRIRQSHFEEYARPGDLLEQVPLVVLINGGSASGSEIVAGALKDHGRARLIGERSYGKGSVQSVVPLGTGSALKLTTAHYLTPSGKTINERGIEPDTQVDFVTDTARQYGGSMPQVGFDDDPQMHSALESLGYQAIALSQAQ